MADTMMIEQVRDKLRNWCDPHKGYPSAEMNDWADAIDAAIRDRDELTMRGITWMEEAQTLRARAEKAEAELAALKRTLWQILTH